MTAGGRALTILFYLPSLGGGGAERLIATLATALARRGHRIVLAVDTAAPENERFLDPAIERVRLGAGHAASAWALRGLLRRLKPDVSLSALGGQNLKHLAAALLAGRLSRATQSWHGFYEGEPKLLSRLSYLATPLSSRLLARSIAVSDALREDMVARFRASPRRSLRIHNGFAALSVARQAAEPLVLACGRMTPDKDYPLLLRAFSKMRRPARLVILGEGPERAAIAAEAARLGVAERVAMPGYCETAPWYARASCFAITSVREAFGLVVVEALAAGLPVVTTDSGGPPEILAGLGAVVAGRDEDAFAAALDAALDAPGDPAPRQARAAAFSMEACADAYEAVFQAVAAGRRP